MKGPRLTNTQSRGMRNGTTRYATYTPCLVKEPQGHAIASSERYRLMAGDSSFSGKNDSAVSPVIAEILLVAITLLLAVLIAAALSGSLPLPEIEEPVPEIIKITGISHTNSAGTLTYAGIITMKHIGFEPLATREYGMYLYVNEKLEADVETLNSHDFIATEHDNIRLLYGDGPKGDYWEPEYIGIIDVADKLVKSESLVMIEIYRKDTGDIISRSKMYAPRLVFP